MAQTSGTLRRLLDFPMYLVAFVGLLCTSGLCQSPPSPPGGPFYSATGDPLLDQALVDLAQNGVTFPLDTEITAGPKDGAVGLTEWGPTGGKIVTIDTQYIYGTFPGATLPELLALLEDILYHEHKHVTGPDSLGGVATAESACKKCRIAVQSSLFLCMRAGQGYSALDCPGIKSLCEFFNIQTGTDNENISACIQSGCAGVTAMIPTCEICEECFPF